MMMGWSGVVLACALACVATTARAQCKGDFNADGMVTIDELVTAVENALSGCDTTPRFVDNGDGTITDKHTGLMWEKKIALDGVIDPGNLRDADNLYQWAGTCTPSPDEVFCQPTAEASAICGSAAGCGLCPGGQTCDRGPESPSTIFEWIALVNASNFAGHQDWRIPTLEELSTLVDRGRAEPAVDPAFHGDECGSACTDVGDPDCACTSQFLYWSTTGIVSGRARVWTVRFDIGVVDGGALSFDVFARAVRAAVP
jgi:hypothetical protein